MLFSIISPAVSECGCIGVLERTAKSTAARRWQNLLEEGKWGRRVVSGEDECNAVVIWIKGGVWDRITHAVALNLTTHARWVTHSVGVGSFVTSRYTRYKQSTGNSH